MDREKCKGCPFYKVYYMGTATDPKFAYLCMWAFKDLADVKEEECKNSTKRV